MDRISEKIRFLSMHVSIICLLVAITAKVLDWYNPFMDFGGHLMWTRVILVISVIIYAVLTAEKFIREKKNRSKV